MHVLGRPGADDAGRKWQIYLADFPISPVGRRLQR
jgi:hypothetical protein